MSGMATRSRLGAGHHAMEQRACTSVNVAAGARPGGRVDLSDVDYAVIGQGPR
jgi:hypothetical protein